MKMPFTLNWRNYKTSNVSQFIESVSIGIAIRRLFKKLCVKNKVLALKMWSNLRESEQPCFSLLQDCLLWGGKCDVVKDPKHPDRWQPAYVCREGETFGNRGLKQAILEACEKRKDTQSEQIRVRMAGIFADLHAADVRYHVDCKATFLSPNSIQAAIRRRSIASSELKDPAFDSVINYLAKNKTSVHNSIHIHIQYVEEGGRTLAF